MSDKRMLPKTIKVDFIRFRTVVRRRKRMVCAVGVWCVRVDVASDVVGSHLKQTLYGT